MISWAFPSAASWARDRVRFTFNLHLIFFLFIELIIRPSGVVKKVTHICFVTGSSTADQSSAGLPVAHNSHLRWIETPVHRRVAPQRQAGESGQVKYLFYASLHLASTILRMSCATSLFDLRSKCWTFPSFPITVILLVSCAKPAPESLSEFKTI